VRCGVRPTFDGGGVLPVFRYDLLHLDLHNGDSVPNDSDVKHATETRFTAAIATVLLIAACGDSARSVSTGPTMPLTTTTKIFSGMWRGTVRFVQGRTQFGLVCSETAYPAVILQLQQIGREVTGTATYVMESPPSIFTVKAFVFEASISDPGVVTASGQTTITNARFGTRPGPEVRRFSLSVTDPIGLQGISIERVQQTNAFCDAEFALEGLVRQ
jgi:hypothetical protein